MEDGRHPAPMLGPTRLLICQVSLWLNAGVPAPEVAERAGHSVEVLPRVYAKCLDDGQDLINARIDATLKFDE